MMRLATGKVGREKTPQMNYIETGDDRYDQGFKDGFHTSLKFNKRAYLSRSDVNDGYKLIDSIRKVSRESGLNQYELESKLIQIFEKTQKFLLNKGLL